MTVLMMVLELLGRKTINILPW